MIDISNLIETSDPQNWIEILPEFQKHSILEMKSREIPYEEMAGIWLTNTIKATSPFSANGVPPVDRRFAELFKTEFRAFICGDKKYDKDRKEITVANKGVRNAIVSAIALALAPHVGASAVFITPVVVLSLAAMGKISINAWCKVGDDQAVDSSRP